MHGSTRLSSHLAVVQDVDVRHSTTTAFVLCLLTAVVAGSCASDNDSSTPPSAGEPTVIAEGFDQPTQIVDGPDGLLIVAQLAGDESAATGEIVALDPTTGAREVVLDGLDKPTGVLWRPGELYVMVRRGLLRAPWPGNGAAGPVEVLLADLPFNGRSEGTLTGLADGRIVYETTGTLVAGDAETGSGALWAFDPADGTSALLASGLKNAYGHALLPDGRIITTEIGDNGDERPLEELNVISLAEVADFGWPDCPGEQSCAGVQGPAALFDPTATPTGVAVTGDDVVVSLFVTGELMRVSLAGWVAGDQPRSTTVVVSGLKGPHTVLVRPDGALWISEHLTGRILSITL